MTLEIDSQLLREHREWLDKIRADAFEQGKRFGWQKGNDHGFKKGMAEGKRRGHISGAWAILQELPEEERERLRLSVLGPPPPLKKDDSFNPPGYEFKPRELFPEGQE